MLDFIIPAIDIKEGKVVRLYKGEFNKEKVYFENPEEVALKFKEKGFKRIHVIDLDGAKGSYPANIKALERIRKVFDEGEIEFGGGLRSKEIIENILTIPTQYNEKAVKKFLKDEVLTNLREFVLFLKDKNPHLPPEWHNIMDEFLKLKEIKPKFLMPPLRIAMVGDTKGIDLAALLSVLGKEEVIKRINSFLAKFLSAAFK